MALLVGNVPFAEEGDEAAALAEFLGIDQPRLLNWELVKKSLDARHKRQVWSCLLYTSDAADE